MEAKHKVVKKQIPKVVPYVNPNSDNMGLSGYGMVLFEGTKIKEQLICLTNNGINRYLTGLNEYAPEIQNEEDPEVKNKKIRSIREKVVFLEKALISNVIDIEDKDFWSKVKVVYPSNEDFWKNIFIEVGNEPLFLDPADPNKLILLSCIEAGGFSSIAKSLEDVKMRAQTPKFYLDKSIETAGTKTELIRTKNEAIAQLTELYNNDRKKMFHITKCLDPNSYRYTSSTPDDIMYQYLDGFINGTAHEKSIKKATQSFLDHCRMSKEDVILKAIVCDAAFYKIIQTKGDQMIYHVSTDSVMGHNLSDVHEYMKNPIHAKIAEQIQKDVEKYWKE